MEIEKKFLVKNIDFDLQQYHSYEMEQGYLNVSPVVRIRRKNEDYILTYKSKAADCEGVCVNQEVEVPLNQESFLHLKEKIDGHMVEKTRYIIPYGEYKIELDIFRGDYEGLVVAEVEFPTVEAAESFSEPSWFGKNVSDDYHYRNAYMATGIR